ncbi:MAG: GntR family transcriptional regulator, partial [Cytophagales bacterium]|nr:GntR family transcriptional regulator [Armatimonadota bacterium]
MQTKTLIKAQDFKHQQVAKELRRMIAALKTGDRLPAVAALGRHFAVAPATVEAAMGELRREGLVVRRQGSGTYVAPTPGRGTETPTNPKTNTGLIAVLGAGEEENIGGGCYLDTLRAVEAALNTLDYAPLLILDSDPTERGRRARERWEKGRIDGIIHIGSTDIEALAGLPAVVIGETPQAGRVSQVVVDNEAAGQRVGEYLWNLGHRRVAFITTSGLDLFAAPRLRGLQRLWAARTAPHSGGVQEATFFWNREMTEAQMRDAKKIALENLLRGDNPPTALFASQDEAAITAL